MHRTQVLLEERQYAALRDWGRRMDKGLSELIRLAVDRLLDIGSARKGRSRLRSVCGLASDPAGPSGREHDRFLYGNPR